MQCQICGNTYRSITNTHLRGHSMCLREYIDKFGEFRSSDTKKKMEANKRILSGPDNPMFGQTAWNRGKTKDTDERIRKGTRSGVRHSQWKGGISKHSDGYLEISAASVEPEFKCMAQRNNNQILLHRYLAAKYIAGRPLLRNETVHHIDEDKTNNDIANLRILTHSEHMRLHYLQRKAAGNACLNNADSLRESR